MECKKCGRLKGLDLFSGIGGISLALRPYVQTTAYCEIDRYCQAVLLSRMESCDLDLAPIWDDVKTLRGEMLGEIDIISGGFPCQNISKVGNGEGLDGEQSGLFSEIVRLAEELKPQFLFLENVPAIRTRGLCEVVERLSYAGYDCRWDTFTAEEIGASHVRERWFLLAYSTSQRLAWEDMQREDVDLRPTSDIVSEHTWKADPEILRKGNGLSRSVDRIIALGNAVVPQTARLAFEKLSGLY